MALWRFDQGRLDYLQFDEVKNIARALTSVDGIAKPDTTHDFLRKELSKYSARPFAPSSYTVWRNYKRVFGCLMLATDVNGKIICTNLCKMIASESNKVDVDDYLGHFATHFYYPSPVFDGYNTLEPQVFPIIAVIKLLIARFLTKGEKSISVDDIGNYLIANQVTGLESIDFYSKLKKRAFNGDLRQPRELLRFISQFSFFKWDNPNLYFEISDKAELLKFENLLKPQLHIRAEDAGAELLNLGATYQGTLFSDLTLTLVDQSEIEFTEGKRTRATHLRTERSKKLKEFYFAHVPNPQICDMCSMDTGSRYPWARHIIELHHLLPLSSPVKVETGKTSLKDVVGICPTCHRGTHKYYSTWLNYRGQKDFENDEEARSIYEKVKQEIVIP